MAHVPASLPLCQVLKSLRKGLKDGTARPGAHGQCGIPQPMLEPLNTQCWNVIWVDGNQLLCMFDVCFGENGPLPNLLDQLNSHVHCVLCDRPVLGGDAGVDGDALEWSREVMNNPELAWDFLLP